jgi:replication factor C subunit 3/5
VTVNIVVSVVVICEADCLTKDAQHALRRTMEKYVATCRIILVANTISRVIPAIRSRCLGVRVGAPTKEEIINILQVRWVYSMYLSVMNQDICQES